MPGSHDTGSNVAGAVVPHWCASQRLALLCRRLLRNGRHRPQGVLPGHTEGVTHVSARGDGRHLLSNGKDSTARIWDIRKMYKGAAARQLPSVRSLPLRGRADIACSRICSVVGLSLASCLTFCHRVCWRSSACGFCQPCAAARCAFGSTPPAATA
jgi:WD40 repeat protein